MEFEENRYSAWVSQGVPAAWAELEQRFIDATTKDELLAAGDGATSELLHMVISAWKSDQRHLWLAAKWERLAAEAKGHHFDFMSGQMVRYVGNDWPMFRVKQFYFHSYGWDTSLVNVFDSSSKMYHLMPACYMRPGVAQDEPHTSMIDDLLRLTQDALAAVA
jgi:hypothetical protein